MSENYKLVGHEAIQVHDLLEWGKWMQTADRKVAKTEIDGQRISTVFLGLDHNWDAGPPAIFETMVFGGALDGEQDRYSTWEEAEAGHAAMVERVKESAK